MVILKVNKCENNSLEMLSFEVIKKIQFTCDGTVDYKNEKKNNENISCTF